MATTVKAKSKQPGAFGPDILAQMAAVGDATEVRFRLRRVKLADGEYHPLTKALTVRVKWDDAVGYFVAFDTRHLFAEDGDTAAEALEGYLDDWGEKLDWLTQHEAELGKPLQQELQMLRKLLSLASPNAA